MITPTTPPRGKPFFHFLVVVVAVIAAAVPAIAADPAARAFVDGHPELAAWLPLVAGIIAALYHAARGTP